MLDPCIIFTVFIIGVIYLQFIILTLPDAFLMSLLKLRGQSALFGFIDFKTFIRCVTELSGVVL